VVAASLSEELSGWSEILQALSPRSRALFKEAYPYLDGDRLELAFPYHCALKEDYQAELAPLVRGWLGERAWDGLTGWTDFWCAAAGGANAGE
jgi:hypothetical protein